MESGPCAKTPSRHPRTTSVAKVWRSHGLVNMPWSSKRARNAINYARHVLYGKGLNLVHRERLGCLMRWCRTMERGTLTRVSPAPPGLQMRAAHNTERRRAGFAQAAPARCSSFPGGRSYPENLCLPTFPPCSRKPPLRSDSSSRGTPRRRSSSDAAA